MIMKNISNSCIFQSPNSFLSYFIILICLCGLLIVNACSRDDRPLLSFMVTETAGVSRLLDYIEIDVDIQQSLDISSGISIRERGLDSLVQGQVLAQHPWSSGKMTLRCLFPVSLDANSSKTYEVIPKSGTIAGEILKIEGADINIKIENEHYVADLTDRKATPENGLGPGQLSGLVLKQFDDKLLERSHINMHWAPNFQRDGLDYKTFGHIRNADSVHLNKGPYYTSLFRSGFVDGYNEIHIRYFYEFYAGLPYFFFSSVIEMTEDVDLFLLRNDEMTMDSLFTHVMFLRRDSTMNVKALYNDPDMRTLEENPIEDDAPWLAFFNNVMNYGFGSVRMEYDNKNLNGTLSPLYGEHTKITSSVNNGRYWNRRLIHEHPTKVPRGSRYHEKNAYLVFKAMRLAPSREITQYAKRIANPLQVEYLAE